MNYSFSNILGAPYRGGNVVFHGNDLLSVVGNRVHQFDLVASTSSTLPFGNSRQVQTIAVSPEGDLLLSVDKTGRAILCHRSRRILLHHFSFKEPVSVARFSPDGKFIACGVGRLVQVWRTPSLQKTTSPMQLHRTYGHCHDTVTSVDWSPDGQWIVAGCKDLTARVFCLDPIEGYKPPTLAGHKSTIVAVFFAGPKAREAALVLGQDIPEVYSVGQDGVVFCWGFKQGTSAGTVQAEDGTVDKDGGGEDAAKRRRLDHQSMVYAGGQWYLIEKHTLWQRGASVSAVDYHRPTAMLVIAYSSGVFDLYQLPDGSHIQSLSISNERITTVAFNSTGEWLALGAAQLGQLLVWEWRSETYVLKQQGHYYDVSSVAFSPDGSSLVTAADDAKVKVWSLLSGVCYVTFPEHTAAVTAVAFIPTGHAVVSASLDGTVRAFDLIRYRNFRTLTSPTPVQFMSLAVDPSGEVICAGSQDTFQIFVWSLKTGRLLDIVSGHEGPVCGLTFTPVDPMLASCSWDKTVRIWDVYGGKGALETLQHSHDVLALSMRPDAKQLASATLDGQIWLWNPMDGVLQGTIEGRRDIAAGRSTTDRRSAANSSSGQCFTSLVYSADGSFLLAGGSTKYVCMYDVAERVLLRRFQISDNKSLDGMMDMLNSRRMTDAGPLDLIDDEEEDGVELLPPSGAQGAAGAADLPGALSKRMAPSIRTRCVALSPTSRQWAAATTEGVVLFGMDEGLLFDPTNLAEDITPAAVAGCLRVGGYLRALLIALRLNDPELIRQCILSTPPHNVNPLVEGLPHTQVNKVLAAVCEGLNDSPHLEFLLTWLHQLCVKHSATLRAGTASTQPTLRLAQKALNRIQEDLAEFCNSNLYTLDFLCSAASDT